MESSVSFFDSFVLFVAFVVNQLPTLEAASIRSKNIMPLNSAAQDQQVWVRCSSELEEIVVVGEVAYSRSRDALSVTQREGGEAMQLAGYRITIYRQQIDGGWFMVRDAHTLSPVEKLGSYE